MHCQVCFFIAFKFCYFRFIKCSFKAIQEQRKAPQKKSQGVAADQTQEEARLKVAWKNCLNTKKSLEKVADFQKSRLEKFIIYEKVP